MQCRSPNATLDSCCQQVYIVTYRLSHLSDIVHHAFEWCAGEFIDTVVFTQVHYYARRIVNIMEGYIVRNNLQIVNHIDFVHV